MFHKMIKLQALIAIIFTGPISFWSDKPPIVSNNETGLFIWHYMIKQNPSEKFVELMAPDSIFYYNGYAIESILRNEEVQSADGKMKSYNIQNGYHLIDFTKRQFYRSTSLTAPKSEGSESWQPIENKKVGIRFDYPFYSGEKFTSKDTIINNRPYQSISFVNNGVQAKGARVTLYLEPNMSSPIPFYAIQKYFKGRLSMISILDKFGETRMVLDYQKAPSDSPILKILREMEKAITAGQKKS